VAHLCREGVVGLDLTPYQGALARAATLAPAQWPAALTPAVAHGLDAALAALEGGA